MLRREKREIDDIQKYGFVIKKAWDYLPTHREMLEKYPDYELVNYSSPVKESRCPRCDWLIITFTIAKGKFTYCWCGISTNWFTKLLLTWDEWKEGKEL